MMCHSPSLQVWCALQAELYLNCTSCTPLFMDVSSVDINIRLIDVSLDVDEVT